MVVSGGGEAAEPQPHTHTHRRPRHKGAALRSTGHPLGKDELCARPSQHAAAGTYLLSTIKVRLGSSVKTFLSAITSKEGDMNLGEEMLSVIVVVRGIVTGNASRIDDKSLCPC